VGGSAVTRPASRRAWFVRASLQSRRPKCDLHLVDDLGPRERVVPDTSSARRLRTSLLGSTGFTGSSGLVLLRGRTRPHHTARAAASSAAERSPRGSPLGHKRRYRARRWRRSAPTTFPTPDLASRHLRRTPHSHAAQDNGGGALQDLRIVAWIGDESNDRCWRRSRSSPSHSMAVVVSHRRASAGDTPSVTKSASPGAALAV
jgi:hypothetical protein